MSSDRHRAVQPMAVGLCSLVLAASSLAGATSEDKQQTSMTSPAVLGSPAIQAAKLLSGERCPMLTD
jgi:hypothetical protein